MGEFLASLLQLGVSIVALPRQLTLVFLNADHLESNLQRWIAKYAEEPASSSTSLKRQRRFAKYERELLDCGKDIHALSRFCRAQVTAFRKILKKYKVRLLPLRLELSNSSR